MHKILIAFYCVLIAMSGYAQQSFVTEETKAREQLYSEEYANYWHYDDSCDTLLLEDDTPVLLLRTPIRYIEGYTGLFRTNSKNIFDIEALITNHSGLGARGYFMTWRLKDKKLYLEKVCWNRLEWLDWNNNLEPKSGPDVSPEEIKRRVEQLTSRKFNEEGLLFADWVTDRILIVKHHPFQLMKEKSRYMSQSLEEVRINQFESQLFKGAKRGEKDRKALQLNRSQKIFALDFMRGCLRDIHECININHEQLLNELHDKDK